MKRHLFIVVVVPCIVGTFLASPSAASLSKKLYGCPKVGGYEIAQTFCSTEGFRSIGRHDNAGQASWYSEKRQLYVDCSNGKIKKLIGTTFRCGDYEFSEKFDQVELVRILHPAWLTTYGKGQVEGELAALLKAEGKQFALFCGRYQGNEIPVGGFNRDKPLVLYQLISGESFDSNK